MNSMMEYRHLSDEDLAVLSMVLLTLLDFGFCIPSVDVDSPGFVKSIGPHKVYEIVVRLRDDEVFNPQAFTEQLDKYAHICKAVKPHYYGVEEYPAYEGFCFDTVSGTAKTRRLHNFHDVYISVFI